MTAHTTAPSRSRRRRRGATHASSGRRRGTGRVWAGLVALTVLGAAGFAAAQWAPPGDGEARTEAGQKTAPDRKATPTPTTDARSTQRAKPAPAPSRSTTTPTIPATGPGTFVTASGGSPKVGSGRTLRYRVEVETGLDLSTADAAEQVDRVLADPRGWTADGTSAFQRISSGTADFVVKVATPGTVDKICATQGLDTGGEYNCSVNDDVMVNLKRWELATQYYADDVRSYRALIINHEVGHFLGHGHVTCPGPGKPAPAMMQQIKGLKGCVPNVWPYDAQGRLITGPAAP
ncbi:DUF3152 domain-containing protein [Streptomyces sp. NBC_00124]|uniref:DUF3152 domain-containing protein n=1 Tax=Streptomyces sp. NBC_00124 TaxID=2975662 RepID=UPI00224F3943|nr:DUF3152 domain-containing protein [Streptomyces sp. NBC_00124]MCX5361131.1 DUF3152 domain-containing protein [Streptomyces sp. NBC_00124]